MGAKGKTTSLNKTAKFAVIDAPGVSQPVVVQESAAADTKTSNKVYYSVFQIKLSY